MHNMQYTHKTGSKYPIHLAVNDIKGDVKNTNETQIKMNFIHFHV